VFDLGGGSTEWAGGSGVEPDWRRSIPVGAVRFTQDILHGDPPSAAQTAAAEARISAAFAALPDMRGASLIATGGTMRAMAMVYASHAGLAWEEARHLPRTEVQRQIAAYAGKTAAGRRAVPGLDAERADIILAGALIADACMQWAGASRVTVTDAGVRHGLILDSV
jgi:exopolyphosphatase/guanosine-5'-triphosphate,3'-diphosphate pyrophosphatase